MEIITCGRHIEAFNLVRSLICVPTSPTHMVSIITRASTTIDVPKTTWPTLLKTQSPEDSDCCNQTAKQQTPKFLIYPNAVPNVADWLDERKRSLNRRWGQGSINTNQSEMLRTSGGGKFIYNHCMAFYLQLGTDWQVDERGWNTRGRRWKLQLFRLAAGWAKPMASFLGILFPTASPNSSDVHSNTDTRFTIWLGWEDSIFPGGNNWHFWDLCNWSREGTS